VTVEKTKEAPHRGQLGPLGAQGVGATLGAEKG
jgi:hypothetical protein